MLHLLYQTAYNSFLIMWHCPWALSAFPAFTVDAMFLLCCQMQLLLEVSKCALAIKVLHQQYVKVSLTWPILQPGLAC